MESMSPNQLPASELSPEEIAQMEKSRTISDAELLKDGAEYSVDNIGRSELRPTDKQIELIKKIGMMSEEENNKRIEDLLARPGGTIGLELLEKDGWVGNITTSRDRVSITELDGKKVLHINTKTIGDDLAEELFPGIKRTKIGRDFYPLDKIVKLYTSD